MRIVSLLPSSTEIVCKLGYREQLVGISHECDYPITVKELPVLTKPRFSPKRSSQHIDKSVQNLLKNGLSVYEVNTELLKDLAPDLIITQAQCEACAVSLNDVKEASGLGSAARWIKASNPSNLPLILLLLDKSICIDSNSCFSRVKELILYLFDNPFLSTLPIVPSAPVIPIFILFCDMHNYYLAYRKI